MLGSSLVLVVPLLEVGVGLPRLTLTLLKRSVVLDFEGRGRAVVVEDLDELEARRELSCDVKFRELGRASSFFCFLFEGSDHALCFLERSGAPPLFLSMMRSSNGKKQCSYSTTSLEHTTNDSLAHLIPKRHGLDYRQTNFTKVPPAANITQYTRQPNHNARPETKAQPAQS